MRYIKSLFFGLLILSASVITRGQTNKFDICIEGSPSLIFLRGNDVIKQQDPTIGFSGGLSLQFNSKKNISFRTNLSYERKGSAFQSLVYDQSGEIKGDGVTHSNFDYLTLPILARATFGNNVQFFLNAGPFFGYLIKQTFLKKSDYGGSKIERTYNYQRFDTGISTGLGLYIPIKEKFAFSFELRNNLGLYNVSALSNASQRPIKTNSTNFLLGFNFKLGQHTSDAK